MLIDEQEKSVFERTFTLKFINLGVIVLIVNSQSFIDVLGLAMDGSKEFDDQWYHNMGKALTVTMAVNIFAPHAAYIQKYLGEPNLEKLKPKTLTQEDYDQAALGDPWQFSVRYAEVLSGFAVCFAYSGGIPILLPVGCALCAVHYAVEKFMILRFYRMPPRYSDLIGKAATKYLPMVAVYKLAISIWMYGNGAIFAADDGDLDAATSDAEKGDKLKVYDKLFNDITQPLTAMMFAIVLALVYFRFVRGFAMKHIEAVVHFLTCSQTE